MFKNSLIKRILTLVMILALACGMLSGCAQSSAIKADAATVAVSNESTAATTVAAPAVTTASGKKVVIGVALNMIADQFMTALDKGLKEEAAKYPNLEMRVVESGSNAATQLSQVEQFIADKVDLICLNPTDKKASVACVDAAVAAGIPIYTCNNKTDAAAQAKCITYVGSDAVESGVIQAKYVAETVLKGKGNVAIIQGVMGQDAQIGRYDGAMSVFKNFPDIKVVAAEPGDWDRSKSMVLMENWIKAKKPIDLVMCQTCEEAIGALLAIQDAGLEGKILVSSIDATPDALPLMEQGKFTNLVFQNARGQGVGAIATGMRILNGEKVDKETIIPYELVTMDNVKEYYAKWQ